MKEHEVDLKNVRKWHHHAIRDFVQSQSQTKELNDLGFDEACIVMDWAMKWLPRFYREKMEQWFAKGGMPWHEAVVFKRVESGEVKKHTFTHVAQESEQTAAQVFFIISDLLKQVKDMFPG